MSTAAATITALCSRRLSASLVSMGAGVATQPHQQTDVIISAEIAV